VYQQVALVAVGGAIGAVLRYGAGSVSEIGNWPTSTFVVNVVGSFALGILVVLAINQGYSDDVLLFFGTGLLGSFTTMSTFSVETITMLKHGSVMLALGYATLSFITCILFAFFGYELGDKLEIG
tara:strand:- start:12 stop:386 length:375 start_codon:yes stop_codon:yes gene_type:complete